MKSEYSDKKSGIDLIAEERFRQLIEEGWTPQHDDGQIKGELAIAASIYAKPHRTVYEGKRPLGWPWEDEWWKPTPNDRIRELVKAGALIAAEIDRLQRQKS